MTTLEALAAVDRGNFAAEEYAYEVMVALAARVRELESREVITGMIGEIEQAGDGPNSKPRLVVSIATTREAIMKPKRNLLFQTVEVRLV